MPYKQKVAVEEKVRIVQEWLGHKIHDVDVMLDEEFLELRYRAEQRYAWRDKQHEKKSGQGVGAVNLTAYSLSAVTRRG